MALFGFQMLVALDNPDASHVEVVIAFLQRRCAEAHAVTCTQHEAVVGLIAEVELWRKLRVRLIGEIVVAHSSHGFEFVGDIPVVLREHVVAVLLACCAGEISVKEIVVHIVGTDGEHRCLAERVVVEQSDRVLHVAVVAYVEVAQLLIVRLVVLVEGVARLQVVVLGNQPVETQAAREVTIAFGQVHGARCLAEEVAGTCSDAQSVGGSPCQLVLEVDGALAVDGGDDTCHGVGGTRHVVVVLVVIVGTERISPVLRAESEHATVALVVVLGVACVHVQRPRLGGVLRDDVHHAARSTTAVQRRRCAFHYLDTLHASHKQTREVDIVHRLACETLAVYEEEDALSAESGEVEVGLLVHRVGELHAGQLLLQQILHVRGIGAGYVARRDDTCLYRCILQELRCACAGHHHFLQFVVAEDGVELRVFEFLLRQAAKPFWVCLRHRCLRCCEESERKEYFLYHLSYCICNYRRVWHLAIPTQSCEFPTDFTDLHR